MAISSTDPTQSSAAAAPAPPQNPKAQMGKDAFMKLLVAELKQQDPTDPVNAREMITQLSQLSSVEKLTAVEQDLSDMKTQNSGATSVQSAGLIGRTIRAKTNHLILGALGGGNGNYVLNGPAENVSVTVRDQKGNAVRTLEGGAQGLGPHSFAWDGNDDAGNRAPSGDYYFDVSAVDSKKAAVGVATELSGIVTEVAYDSGTAQLVVGDSRVAFGDVVSIAE